MKNNSLTLCELANKREDVNTMCLLLPSCQVCMETDFDEKLLTFDVF